MELSNLKTLVTEINFFKNQTVVNIIEIGKRLIVAKDQVTHGEWEEWLLNNVDFSSRQARRFIHLAKEFPNRSTSSVLTTSKAFELLSLPTEEREDFIETNDIESMTTRELREAIKKNKQLQEEVLSLQNLKPKLVVKEVVKEIVPNDYDAIKKQLELAPKQSDIDEERNRANRVYTTNQSLQKENNKLTRELEKLRKGEPKQFNEKLSNTATTLNLRCQKFIEDVGGLIWISDYCKDMNQTELEILNRGVNNILGWATTLKQNIKEVK